MEISLYIATSLDGYIADTNGGTGWLAIVDGAGEDYGYQTFYDSVDALVMGSRTYEQVRERGGWPWPGKPAWVLSSRRLPAAVPEVTVTDSGVNDLLSELAMLGIGHTWLVGGAETAAPFIRRGLVTRYVLSRVPVILGDGIPLFLPGVGRHTMTLVENRRFHSGLVQQTWEPAGVY